jgi:hypothetical protein
MRNWEVGAAGLIAAVVLVAVAFMVGPQHAAWIPTIAAGVVLLVIFAYDRVPQRTFAQSLAYAATGGFLLLAFAIYPVSLLLSGSAAAPVDAIAAKPWLPTIWLAGSLIFLAIDRFRLGSKPVVLQMETPATPVVNAAASVVIPPMAAPQQVFPTPVPVVSAEATVVSAEAIPAAVAIPQPPVQAPPVQTVPRGTPATVYLNLVGTGIACLRSVKAEHLGKDFYRITEEVPQGEAWEFPTGAVVRCRKKTLSSGKAMVAYEEAPRA